VPDGAEKNYADTFKVLDDYFIPKANVPFERHLFRQISQSSEETVDRFVCRLRQRGASCEFGEREDEYIRDQLIDKCYSAKLRRKFLEKEGSVTLDDLLVTARAQEAVNLQMEAMGANNSSGQVNTVVEDGAREGDVSSEQVNSVADVRGGTSSEKRDCFNSGRVDHFARDRRCSVRGRKCDQCGEIGHFKVKCRKKLAKDSYPWQRQGDDRHDWRNTGRKTNTNYVDSDIKSGQDSTPNNEFSVGDRLGERNGVVIVVVGAVHLPNVLIDSGATCNLLGQGPWEWLKSQKIQCQTRKEAKALFSYGNTKPLPTLGTFTADMMSFDIGATCKTDFVVLNGDGRSLICRETAEKLGLLRLGPSHTVNVVNTEADINEKYKELFNGVGHLRDYELKLNIDDSVKPVAQPVRRIPFGVREKVER